ncbi:MAG TPA: agmatinase [Thermoguttaceae bacterium]|nr:agmatinase [Thermoguttaceae bacterium]
MNGPTFLDLPDVPATEADAIVLPLPYEGTVSFGRGTAQGPEAVWRASAQIELWDEELSFPLDSLRYHTAPAVVPRADEPPEAYLERVFEQGQFYQAMRGLVMGVGGEHSLTPALLRAALDDGADLSDVTVVQFDAHADLRDTYEGTPHNHACAMRRLVERGARLVAIGIRSADREEAAFAQSSDLVRTFPARRLAVEPDFQRVLLDCLGELAGPVYLTIDVDALEVSLCPATGTPQPGGLDWWTTLGYLRRLLRENRRIELIGCDVVETVPQPCTLVNETVAAALLAKILVYHFAPSSPG